MSEKADALLAALAKGPPADVEDAIVRCAELYIDGEAEPAHRAFALVRPLVRIENYEGWARTRLELLDELNLLGHSIGRDPIFPALARALLAEDTSELDDIVDARFRGKPVPLPSSLLFERTPRAARAFHDAFEVPRTKARIRERTIYGVIIATLIALPSRGGYCEPCSSPDDTRALTAATACASGWPPKFAESAHRVLLSSSCPRMIG